ncbi:MAG: efflux RND transporter periplasmic adaptor subunit [Gemmatimonadales bacterium]|nr:efflux RND transporter periplasmic adaptor subunit [Gemmatimonadales bacterium]
MSRPQSIALLAVLTGFSLLGCGNGSNAADAPVETPAALVGAENLAIAEQRQILDGPVVSGTLTAERTATIRAEMSTTVAQVNVEAGQPVARGQSLGRLNDDGVRDAALSARSGVRTATEALVLANRNVDRADKLAKAGAVAESELEQARQLALNAEAQLADAKARQAAADKQLANTELRAPIGGVVSERHVNVGDNVSPGTALITVVDPNSLRLEAQVPVTAVSALKPGTPVPFAVDGYPDRRFEGKVTRINPAVDPATRQVRITVGLPNASGRLVAGLFAQGQVGTVQRDGIVVPTSAVDRRGIRPTVTRIAGGVAQRIEVTLGIEDQAREQIEVIEGIAAGDTVITGAARGIQPGTRVRASVSAERPASPATR